jgi:pimeloyl-ACP methyl ester carboxylesterase
MSAIAFVVLGVLAAPVALYAILVVGVAVAYARLALYGTAGVASLGLIAREARAQLVVLGWTMLRRGRSETGGDGRPVVLVHGLAADGCSMWGYRRALIALGRPTSSPHLGGMFRSIEKYAHRLVSALDRIPGDVDVVCHSMGGIVLRATLAMRPDLAARIKHVVTVASPHTGTAGARGVPLPEARQLSVGAPYLDGLPPLPQLLPGARFTTIASDADAVVYPNETCCVAGSEHHELHGIGHAELLVHEKAVDLVVAAVA